MRSNSRWPFGLGGDGDDHRGRDDPPAGAYLDVGGVELEVGPGALERAGQERLDAGVDVLAEARDLTLRDAVHPHRLHQVVDRAGRDALDIGLLDDRGERLLGRPAGL